MAKNGLKLVGLAGIAALTLSACGGGSSSDSSQIISLYNGRITQPLIGAASNERYGTEYLSSVFSGTVYLDALGKPHMDAAQSVESSDNSHWVVKLRPNQKFTDGEAVTAKSFVDAWNFGAKLSSAMANRDFYSDIQGFTQQGNNDLSGLKVVNDLEFTIDLKTPSRSFILRLAHQAFCPLPESAYKDIQTFGQHPVGNGPYKIESFSPGVEMKLVRNPDYTGPRQPRNAGLTFKIYTNPESAYNDALAGNLDVLGTVPANALRNFRQDFKDRWISEPVAQTWYLIIPRSVPHFGFDQEGILRRRAVSLAIDRSSMVKEIFFDTRAPAKEFTSPVFPGYDPRLPGSGVLLYDPAEAKKLWQEADAISPYTGTFKINYSLAVGDAASYEAMAHQLSNNLGISALAVPHPTWGGTRDAGINKHEPFRVSYSADWPAQSSLLTVLFRSHGIANFMDYSSPEFDKLLSEADAAKTEDRSDTLFKQAQEVLFKDMPAIPLFYQNGVAVWSSRMNKPTMTWMGASQLWTLQAKS